MTTTPTHSGIRVVPAATCRLCGAPGELRYSAIRDRLFGVPGTWNVRQCAGCALAWLDPRPLDDEIGKLYPEYQTHAAPTRLPHALPDLRGSIRREILATTFGYRELADGARRTVAGRILSRTGLVTDTVGVTVGWLPGHTRGRLLDVGCGHGAFLAVMRDLGWKVAGVELDPVAVTVARDHFGLDINQGPLEEARFSDNQFDAITISHVIEHVADPVGLLRECHRILEPGGRIVVVTPNIESLGHRIFGEAWRGLEVPRHLVLFSTRSLRRCAEGAGLRVLELRTMARGARWMWAASSSIRRDGGLPGGVPRRQNLRRRLEGVVFQLIEHAMTGIPHAGEELLLIATK